MKKNILSALVALFLCLSFAGCGNDLEGRDVAVNEDLRILNGHIIAMNVNGRRFVVSLYDNPTVDDLLSRLPLTLTANNYGNWMEKIMPLTEPLSMLGAPEGDNPKIPEVGYYRPGNWIALYYGFIGYWEGKVPLGQIDASPDEIRNIPAGSSVTIELID